MLSQTVDIHNTLGLFWIDRPAQRGAVPREDRTMKCLGALAAVVLVALAACSPDSDEPDSENYYADRSITVIVPTSPGGGSDTFARQAVPYLERYIPGNPSIQVQNIEGGGLVTGTNQWYRGAKDGTNIVMMSTTNLGAWLLGQEGVAYDLEQMRPVLGSASGVVAFVREETGVESVQDLSSPDTQLVYPGTSATGSGTLAVLTMEVLGIREDVNVVMGYEGAGAQDLAFAQGEANFGFQSGASYVQNVLPLVEEGEARPLLALGLPDGQGGTIRDPALPELPTVAEVYEELNGAPPSGEAWDALTLSKAVMPFRGFFVHGDIPEEALEALETGARATLEDAEYLAAAAAELGDYPLYVGDDWDPIMTTIREADPAVREWLQTWLRDEYDVRTGG